MSVADDQDDPELLALKRALVDALEARLTQQQLSRAAFAERLNTSRNQIYRLLDPATTGVTLSSLSRAARALGWSITGLLAAADRRAVRAAATVRRARSVRRR